MTIEELAKRIEDLEAANRRLSERLAYLEGVVSALPRQPLKLEPPLLPITNPWMHSLDDSVKPSLTTRLSQNT